MRPISAAKYLAVFFTFAFGVCAFVAFANWLVDPLQYYRRARYASEFSDQTRYQNPGLARNYPYDTVIIGTSVSRGFDVRQIRARLGWEALNLAMHGASAREQSLMLEVALRTGRVHRVVWDVNAEFLRGHSDWVSDFDGAFPAYFYDTNPLDKLPNYLLNIDTTKASLRVLLRACGISVYRSRTVAELSGIEPGRKAIGREAILEKWRRNPGDNSVFHTESRAFTEQLLNASFDENVLRLIRAHPEVEFDLWFPPFSIVYHAIIRKQTPSGFDAILAFKRQVFAQVKSLPNARLYDFQGIPELVLNLDRYLDAVHFDASGCQLIIESLARNEHRATSENLAATEALLRRESTPEALERLP